MPASQATMTVPPPPGDSTAAHATLVTAEAWGAHVQPDGQAALSEQAIVCATQLEVDVVVVVQMGVWGTPASAAAGSSGVTRTLVELTAEGAPAELLLEAPPPALPLLATPTAVPPLPEHAVTVSGTQLNPGPQSVST